MLKWIVDTIFTKLGLMITEQRNTYYISFSILNVFILLLHLLFLPIHIESSEPAGIFFFRFSKKTSKLQDQPDRPNHIFSN